MLVQSRKQFLETLVIGAIAIACMVGIGALQRPRLARLQDASQTMTQDAAEQAEQAKELQLRFLDYAPDFGFDNLMADWVFLNFVQYFGDTPAREHTGYRLSPEYFDVILARDPYFRLGYFFLSASTSLYAGMPQRTVDIIERELPHLSPTLPDKAYYVWRYKGIDELLFLGDTAAARESFTKVTEWASVYSDKESQQIARSSAQTVQFLKSNPDSRSAQISVWTMVFNNAFDEATQQLAINQMRNLGATVSTDENGNLQVSLPKGE
ncbi:MAG: hypothetical protein ACFE0I_25430 [Elainellaceae cyanobacterium]